MKYLGKRKLYELVQAVKPYTMPKCMYCSYKFYSGYEKLWFYVPDVGVVRFTVYKCGVYVRLEEFDDDNVQTLNLFLTNLDLQMRGIDLGDLGKVAHAEKC